MMPQDIDFDLSEEERNIRDLVHRFAEEVMRPAGQALDRRSAAEVIGRDSILWEVHKKWDDLGVRMLTGERAEFTPGWRSASVPPSFPRCWRRPRRTRISWRRSR